MQQITGITRKIDDLGRIVLPKELRKYLNINTGDDFQIKIEDEKIILEKYSRLERIEDYILKIINCFSNVLNYEIYLIIGNRIINNYEILSNNIINLVNERKIIINDKKQLLKLNDNIVIENKYVIFPIVIDSDLLGSFIVASNDDIKFIINICKILFNIVKINYIN